jgi:hypothetical protein
MKYSPILLLLTSLLLLSTACKPDEAKTAPAEDEFKNARKGIKKQGYYECTLSNGYLMGVQIGVNIDSLSKKTGKELLKEPISIEGKTTESYLLFAANFEKVRIFTTKFENQNIVSRVEYDGTLCKTNRKIGLSSTYSDLKTAYPELIMHSVSKDGKVAVFADGWIFVIGTTKATKETTIDKIDPNARVTTIALQR